MFHYLHDDDCENIDLHLYKMHVNDDDGVTLATPTKCSELMHRS